jgi:hypothetical protein
MGLDTHMIAGSRACSTSIPAQSPDLTNQTNQHFAEALGRGPPQVTRLQRPQPTGP